MCDLAEYIHKKIFMKNSKDKDKLKVNNVFWLRVDLNVPIEKWFNY